MNRDAVEQLATPARSQHRCPRVVSSTYNCTASALSHMILLRDATHPYRRIEAYGSVLDDACTWQQVARPVTLERCQHCHKPRALGGIELVGQQRGAETIYTRLCRQVPAPRLVSLPTNVYVAVEGGDNVNLIGSTSDGASGSSSSSVWERLLHEASTGIVWGSNN